MPGASAPATGVGSAFELTFWQSVANSDDRDQLAAYLAQYPNGTFSALARAKLTSIDRRDAQARGTAAPAAVAPVAAVPVAPPAAAPAPPPASAPAFPANAPPVPVPAPAAPPSGDLRVLGQSQSQGPLAASAAAAATQMAALPPRPVMAAVPEVTLPPEFCSAVDRNNFYDGSFAPSKQVAEQNNRAAIDHIGKLRQIYDEQAKTGNAPAMNVVADEGNAYKAIAQQAYEASAAYEQLFNRMMAVPIRKCS